MANNLTIAHRFANMDFGKFNHLQGSSTHIDGNNYYSYSTVFGQWVDMEKNVCIVFEGDTSVSSRKHMLYEGYFPSNVTVLPYDDGGGCYYGWHGCDLLGYRGVFDVNKRFVLIDYYVGQIYNALAAINGGKKNHLDDFAERTIHEYWEYVMKLCAMYKDTTIAKWLRIKRGNDKEWTQKKKMVRELDAQNFNVQSIVDVMFGEGTFAKYYTYCARYRKAEDKRKQMEKLCERLGIRNPYGNDWSEWKLPYTADEVRKLTAKERLEIHFETLMRKERYDKEEERREKRNQNSDNAYLWITGYAPDIDSKWNHNYKAVRACRNMFTGQEYILSEGHVFGFYWCKKEVRFKYDEFRKAEDKEQWIREFYALCEEVQDNVKGLRILKRVGAHIMEKARSYEDDRYIDDEFLRENTTEQEYWYCEQFIKKQEKHFADEEARRRAAEIARKQKEEEQRKEREYMEQVKQEQIDECLENGIEGCRDLWRKHLMDIHYAERETNYKGDFFMGGNVLLRFSINKDKIESSKSIRMTIATAKAMWKIVSKWHENPASFKQMQIKTLDGTYTISSYENDILTAGCHDIAYAEMEHMYNEIIKLENEAFDSENKYRKWNG